jgi:hypothetical protein
VVLEAEMKYINYFALSILALMIAIYFVVPEPVHYETALVECHDGTCFIHHHGVISVDETELINFKQQLIHDCAIEGHRVVFKSK